MLVNSVTCNVLAQRVIGQGSRALVSLGLAADEPDVGRPAQVEETGQLRMTQLRRRGKQHCLDQQVEFLVFSPRNAAMQVGLSLRTMLKSHRVPQRL